MYNIYEIVRKLAKTSKAQNLFYNSKNISSIHLFENTSELSDLQQLYLSYLSFYHDIYCDIQLKKIEDIILTDEIYENAYARWKSEHSDVSSPKKDKKEHDIKLVFAKSKGKSNGK